MTAFNQAVSGSLGFVGGQDLWPADDLYPSDDLYPFGGIVTMTVGRGLVGVFAPVGVVAPNAGSRTRSFAAVLTPAGALSRGVARGLAAGAVSFVGALARQQSTHVFSKALFASLRAAGALQAMNVNTINPPGGGGYALPMGEEFFRRYKPTLRRQKMRV